MNHWEDVPAIDRVGARELTEAAIADRWRDPAGKLLVVDEQGRVAASRETGRLTPQPCTGERDPQRHHLLGLVGGQAWFAVAGTAEEMVGLRTLNRLLDPVELELATAAVALLNWHAAESFCPRCGGPTMVIEGGFARRCEHCDRQLFPRTDPAVIVAVLDADERLLLGHQNTWTPGRMSLLAGFVEAGESLEQAAHRELLEEVGVRLTELRYFGSQPWPFPRSQMIGLVARAASVEVQVDGIEITEARWFTRAELDAEVAAGRVTLPMPGSIALRMIEAWLGGGLRCET